MSEITWNLAAMWPPGQKEQLKQLLARRKLSVRQAQADCDFVRGQLDKLETPAVLGVAIEELAQAVARAKEVEEQIEQLGG